MSIIELYEKLQAEGFEIRDYGTRNFAIRFRTRHELSIAFNKMSYCSARWARSDNEALAAPDVELAGFNPEGAWMRIKGSKHSVVESVPCEEVYRRVHAWKRRYGK